MVATQAQRAALYNRLVDSMGEEAADTLMDQLPPGGWDQMATKDDLAGLEQRLLASNAELRAEMRESNAALRAELRESNAELRAELRESNAELRAEMRESNAELKSSYAELKAAMQEGFAEAAKERAEIIRSQARQLYVVVTTIVAATVSIWIALFTSAGPG